MQVLFEQAGYQLVEHDGGSYHVIHEEKAEVTTLDLNYAFEHYINCVKEKSTPGATDADN